MYLWAAAEVCRPAGLQKSETQLRYFCTRLFPHAMLVSAHQEVNAGYRC